MDALLERVRLFVQQHALFRPDTRVIAAVSGGSDSVALAHALSALDAAGELHLVGLAHFNHQLRAAADGDQQFVTSIAQALDRPLTVAAGDVAARARREKRSIEDAARRARHEFLEHARVAANADVIAVGHTRDDQAETLLLRLVRGAGSRGLAGMHPRNGHIVRPLLSARRDELRAWLDHRRVGFVHDESNDDVAIPRNRVRAELLPLLVSRFNPAIVDVLADEAELLRDASDWMEAAAADAAARVVQLGPGRVELDTVALSELPMGLQRLLVRQALTRVGGARPIAFGHVEAVLRLTRGGEADRNPAGGRIDLPGQRAERIHDRIVLRGRPPGTVGRWTPEEERQANLFRYSLSIPGEVLLTEAGCQLSAESTTGGTDINGIATMSNGLVAVVDRNAVQGALSVRNRRPGDRFRPIGLQGEKKLQDFFVDRKIARDRRDAVPLVVDGTDRIVWVAGYGIDEAFRATDHAQEVIVLKLKALGGSA